MPFQDDPFDLHLKNAQDDPFDLHLILFDLLVDLSRSETMIVMKFGGSSLATVDKVCAVIELVKKQLHRQPVVVVSAHGKTTNRLIEAAERALEGVVSTDQVEAINYGLVDELGLNRELIEPLIQSLSTLLQGVSFLRELTPRTRDHIMSFGERMSTRIIAAAMSDKGMPAVAVNSYEIGLLTDSEHGSAVPQPGIGEKMGQELNKIKSVPVVTGFLGADKDGIITTIGRSGSDYSASIVAAAIDAEEVQIWTDVNGVMTCDPSVDSTARGLPQLSFDEASELAYYGAEVLHPNTLIPAIRRAIPVRVLNTMNPEDHGTKITSKPVITSGIAKSIVYKEDVCLINLASPRLMSAVKMLSTAFEMLSSHKINIHMATTSEATISLVTDRQYRQSVMDVAIKDLQQLGEVSIEFKKAIICVIGEELRGQVGVLGNIFGALSEQNIKAKMVSQSASELNVAFLIDNDEIEAAVCALHKLML